MNALYILLLLAGAAGFGLHLYAQFKVASLMRRRYPEKWEIVAKPERGRPGRIRTYARFQRVMRSNVPQLFEDADIVQWHRTWRYAPWVAWPCWIAVLLMQVWWHP